MRIHVVSDVHGRVDALARAGDGADALVCLGDLILFVDYADHSQGIFADLFGAENAGVFIGLRAEGRFDEARAMSAELWAALGGDPQAHIETAVRRQYEQIFAAMPAPAYLTYGNVDLPHFWKEYARPGHHVLDGATAEIGGLTFGFVGGGLRTRYRTPYEIDDEEYARKVEAVGEVDVLCCHIPPAIPELLYDVVARRFERGSEATLEAIRRTQPRYALFGHVHQPLAGRTRVGRTECINVGHFRGRGTPFALEW
ncbi:metallophosphoesterase [Planotetraspora sp. A-T 1434]|uniref:metallophosphoesterase family protein n=1 Tax=Planotetraspora sp. A-T 1434 TaxID=2979219 RepID=UPI0021C23FE5|nr:metallophosphoesterase [Planotetraspora sp. A-T 1434]MCT9930133.1 metallophosphoesterase [Planotetraspora sp. A-T 1434]